MKMFGADMNCQPRPKNIKFLAGLIEFAVGQSPLKLLPQFIERKMISDQLVVHRCHVQLTISESFPMMLPGVDSRRGVNWIWANTNERSVTVVTSSSNG